MEVKDYAKERFLKTIIGILLIVIIASIAVSNEWIILAVLTMLVLSTLMFKLMEYLNK